MALNKKQRHQVLAKSDGVCWYCGGKLPEKGWHADHFLPVHRSSLDGSFWKKENDSFGNMVPSCAPCNLLKSNLTIEQFRARISYFIESLNTYTNQYKFAKKYGLVDETKKPVVFWFEGKHA